MGLQDREWYWKERAKKEGYLGPVPASTPGNAPAHPVEVVLRFRPQDRPSSDPWLVTSVWAVAAVFVLVATIALVQWRNQVAAERLVRSSLESLQQVTREAEEGRRRVAADQAMQRADLQRKEAARLEALREQERVRQHAALTAADEVARKNTAWEKFYRRSAKCSDAGTVDCANEFIRARRAFEVKYSAGQL